MVDEFWGVKEALCCGDGIVCVVEAWSLVGTVGRAFHWPWVACHAALLKVLDAQLLEGDAAVCKQKRLVQMWYGLPKSQARLWMWKNGMVVEEWDGAAVDKGESGKEKKQEVMVVFLLGEVLESHCVRIRSECNSSHMNKQDAAPAMSRSVITPTKMSQ